MTGLADTMMSRDQTWLFFTLGRCLERTDVVARQLATVAFDEVFDSGLVMLLRSCGGYEPYLRLSQGVVEPDRVLDFLLRDRLFPRSAFASLTLAEECLDQINSGRDGTWDDARGLVGLARAELEYSAPASLASGTRDPARAAPGLHLLGLRRGDPRATSPRTCPTQWRQRGWRRMSRADGWRMRVDHETRFDYDAPARASYNELRLTPRTERRQTALETEDRDRAAGARSTPTSTTGAPRWSPSTSTAATRCSPSRAARWSTRSTSDEPDDCAWDEVADASLDLADYLSHKLYTAPGRRAGRARARRCAPTRPLETARRIMDAPTTPCATSGVTSVHTSAHEAYADGAGVCQDFAHLALALTKSVGLPSRYVSGYFHPEPDAVFGEEVTGESHAWVEVWTGTGGATTPPTTARSGSGTWPSAAAATTPTCRRSRASTPATRSTPCGWRCA